MTVRVGINGFGRIGRNFFRAAKQRSADIDFVAVNDLGSLETMAHLLKYDSVLGTLPNDVKATKDGITRRRRRAAGAVRARPEGPAVGRARRRRRDRVHRLLHQARHGRRPPRGRRAAGHRVGAVRRRRRHVRLRRQPQGLRLRDPEGDLQRQLHDQLLRADGQGARRRLRRRAGPDADGARLHRRPAARRRPAQGPAPGPRRGDQHRAHQHRRGARHEPRAELDEGQARRHVAARAGTDRSDRRLHGQPHQGGDGRADQRRVQEGRRRAAAEGHPALHRGPDRLERHPGRPAQLHLRRRPHDEHGQAGQGARLVRQRVGLLQPPGRHHAVRRRQGQAARRRR